jgi:hypothetical protein
MFTYNGYTSWVIMGGNNPLNPQRSIFRTENFIWNMDTTGGITVPINKYPNETIIYSIGGVIWNDLKTQFHPIGLDKNSNRVLIVDVLDNGGTWDITMTRGGGGPFDNPNYSGILNRGWLLLHTSIE